MKDKNVAGILALFLGWLGIHRFYLGQVALGIIYCLLIFTGINFILGLIDAIAFFSMDEEVFNKRYNQTVLAGTQRRNTDFDRQRWEDNRRQTPYQRPEKRDFKRERESRIQQSLPARTNPLKTSGKRKFKDYDYQGAIEDFEKALEINPKDIAIHFNLACAYSLTENVDKSFYHLDRAVALGFDDFAKIKDHDALAYLRIQPTFEEFQRNNYRLTPKLEAPAEDLLDTSTNLLDQLKKLGELREKGLLTDEEFAAQKKKLLD